METLQQRKAALLPSVETRPGTLAAALVHLDLAIHPTHEVQAFKRRQRVREFTRDAEFPRIVALLLLGLFFGILSSVAAAAIPKGSELLEAGTFAKAGWFTLFCLTAVVTAASWLALGFGTLCLALGFRESNWQQEPLHQYSRWVPTTVRHDARRLGNVLPDCTFEVERLNIDPFLWASCRGQRYCIAHWDEPGFESS